jgi:hypothetical protein
MPAPSALDHTGEPCSNQTAPKLRIDHERLERASETQDLKYSYLGTVISTRITGGAGGVPRLGQGPPPRALSCENSSERREDSAPPIFQS